MEEKYEAICKKDCVDSSAGDDHNHASCGLRGNDEDR